MAESKSFRAILFGSLFKGNLLFIAKIARFALLHKNESAKRTTSDLIAELSGSSPLLGRSNAETSPIILLCEGARII